MQIISQRKLKVLQYLFPLQHRKKESTYCYIDMTMDVINPTQYKLKCPEHIIARKMILLIHIIYGLIAFRFSKMQIGIS